MALIKHAHQELIIKDISTVIKATSLQNIPVQPIQGEMQEVSVTAKFFWKFPTYLPKKGFRFIEAKFIKI